MEEGYKLILIIVGIIFGIMGTITFNIVSDNLNKKEDNTPCGGFKMEILDTEYGKNQIMYHFETCEEFEKKIHKINNTSK